jgi:8-oxo-dGTP pyrophosphatase MutT (NUDIX family)
MNMADVLSTDSGAIKNVFCNNCRRYGHIFNKCKMPIVSYGILVYRIHPERGPEFLMICRRRTLGYIDFMRGKYSTTNKFYILNMLKQMTAVEKAGLLQHSFDELWSGMWNTDDNMAGEVPPGLSHQYRQEELASRSKFHALVGGVYTNGSFYNMESLVRESILEAGVDWSEPEWGFPKGRRNYQENEYECAAREFFEETGYAPRLLKLILNIYPFEEVFMGSNYKSYKHKYFLNYMDYTESMDHSFEPNTEVSKLEWKTLQECLDCIRVYNEEKRDMIRRVHKCLTEYIL